MWVQPQAGGCRCIQELGTAGVGPQSLQEADSTASACVTRPDPDLNNQMMNVLPSPSAWPSQQGTPAQSSTTDRDFHSRGRGHSVLSSSPDSQTATFSLCLLLLTPSREPHLTTFSKSSYLPKTHVQTLLHAGGHDPVHTELFSATKSGDVCQQQQEPISCCPQR